MENVLIIFAKNPGYGKVKTRLAATIGHARALEVYRVLLAHTAEITRKVDASQIVFYAGLVEQHDAWDGHARKSVQQGGNLGERMANAFQEVLQEQRQAVIIGTDCPELDAQTINQAFSCLASNDVVIGPAADGGYYLLGMKMFHPWLFTDIPWSTPTVFEDTVRRCRQHEVRHHLLPVLHDVDEEKDLKYLPW
ncbi:MAG TPA: TIGR04282 family arsenosugar biosynthesis glycosyltransferase [Puia sp.]|jgi:rSAM/selenodomain-associated transferase 1|nr:TIGR04282 family arsenosugar biosynthesis glycosyltransferase [Puia sp.]